MSLAFQFLKSKTFFIFGALNTLEYVSSFFCSLFLQFFQKFYNKCLWSFHHELICSQVGMMALNIPVLPVF